MALIVSREVIDGELLVRHLWVSFPFLKLQTDFARW
jgi:hypothetical protein